MAGNKYIANNAGALTEVAGQQTSAGVGDANKIPALDATGRLDLTLLPSGVGPDTASVQASENLAAGDVVNVYDGGAGAFRVRKADAATNKPAHGYVLAGVTSGANATIYFEGRNNQVSGLTPGYRFLSVTTPGLTQAAAPTVAGQIVQNLGVAVNATELNFEPAQSILLA